MNTNTNTASANTSILAIDLGKYKSVSCVYDQASSEVHFTTFDTSRAELRRRLDKEQPGVVVIEACLLAGWVHDYCAELGVRCLVANTSQARLGLAIPLPVSTAINDCRSSKGPTTPATTSSA
jgi:hypothetical protein